MTKYVQYQGHSYKIDCNYYENRTGGNSTVHFGKKSMGLTPFLLICVFLAALIIGGVALTNSSGTPIHTIEEDYPHGNDQAILPIMDGEVLYDRFLETGLVFPNSDMAYLTKDEIAAVSTSPYCAELLRYAINELYARHRFSFEIEPYKTHYLNLGFEAEIDMQQARDEFNLYEESNLNILLQLEKS